jgi:hypothetical protein
VVPSRVKLREGPINVTELHWASLPWDYVESGGLPPKHTSALTQQYYNVNQTSMHYQNAEPREVP